MANLLNTELDLAEPITPNNIKYIDTQFITDDFHSKDSDLICEVENKDNIFLIEHQSTVNSIMPIRILNYTKELVKESDESMFLLPERVNAWYNEDIAKATNDGIAKGMAEGMSKGMKKGMEKGKNNELLQLAKKMIKDKMDIKLIKRYTGYTTKQIEDLKKSMS